MTIQLGFIGTGTITSAVVRGIAGDGHSITVSERNAVKASRLASEFDNVTIGSNQTVLDNSDIVFIGLMADVAEIELPALNFNASHRVISLMAGMSLTRLDALTGEAQASAVAIPFPGIALGGSPVLVYGDSTIVRQTLGVRNPLFELNTEDELADYLCAQAVLSPTVQMVGDAASWLGARVTDADQGEAFLRLLISSSLDSNSCQSLIEALDTPGGYNQRLRTRVEDSGVRGSLQVGLDFLRNGS